MIIIWTVVSSFAKISVMCDAAWHSFAGSLVHVERFVATGAHLACAPVQVLTELGHGWPAVQAATAATQLDGQWADAWLTLARCQVRFRRCAAALQAALLGVLCSGAFAASASKAAQLLLLASQSPVL